MIVKTDLYPKSSDLGHFTGACTVVSGLVGADGAGGMTGDVDVEVRGIDHTAPPLTLK